MSISKDTVPLTPLKPSVWSWLSHTLRLPRKLVHDITAYSAEDIQFRVRFSITVVNESASLTDDIVNAHIAYFWSKTMSEIVQAYQSNSIPPVPINPEHEMKPVDYTIELLDQRWWITKLLF